MHDCRNVTIGKYTDGRPNCLAWIDDGGRVEIGRFCSISNEVTFILSGSHRADFVTTNPLFKKKLGAPKDQGAMGDIIVGHDVWIGYGATIIAPSTIGSGAIIGAKAVVKGHVEPYAVVVGNPAREVRKRFTEAQIEALLALRWWDWDEEKLRRNAELLQGPVEKLLISAN